MNERIAVATEPAAEERGRHATNLELFLDLVFVFAVTQIAGVLGSALTVEGVGRGLLLAWLVWWLWSQFTWLGTAINLADRSVAQFQVLATIPLALLMAVAIPSAFEASGLQFAGAYLVVNLWALAIQGGTQWADRRTRSAWLRYVPLAALAPTLLFAGAFLQGDARVVVWAAVAVFNVASALAAGTGGREGTSEWSIDPVHFPERHALFVIISLGEVVVAIGASGSAGELGPTVGAGLVAAAAVACVLWWTYFAYVPRAVERSLRMASGADRGTIARNVFTFGHFPIVFGLLLYAVAAKHAVAHAAEPLGPGDLAVLAGAVASFVGGLAALQWQAVRRVWPERLAVIVGVPLLCVTVGPWLPSAFLLAAIALILAAMQMRSVRNYRRLADPRAWSVPD